VNDVQNFISQLERQRSAIDRAIAALREIGGPIKGSATTAAANTSQRGRGKRRISTEGRKRMAEAARKWWADKKESESTQEPSKRPAESSSRESAPRKRRLSPEGRKAIIDATKKRWAAKRAAGPGRAAAVRKK
jgi:hypothetical protein